MIRARRNDPASQLNGNTMVACVTDETSDISEHVWCKELDPGTVVVGLVEQMLRDRVNQELIIHTRENAQKKNIHNMSDVADHTCYRLVCPPVHVRWKEHCALKTALGSRKSHAVDWVEPQDSTHDRDWVAVQIRLGFSLVPEERRVSASVPTPRWRTG